MSDKPLNLCICWVGISGYLVACWRELASRSNIRLKIIVFPKHGANKNAPFDPALLDGLDYIALDNDQLDQTEKIAALVADFKPDVIALSGWIIPAFNRLPFHPKTSSARFIMGMDTPRKDSPLSASLRQRLARFRIGKFLDRMHRVLVAGERSWQFARRLGIPEHRLRRGVYGINYQRLAPLHAERSALPEGWPRRFLFIGRYDPVKAVDTLRAAYDRYRALRPDNPWPLSCCGAGPMAAHLDNAPGITNHGFVQPTQQPDIWRSAGVFVLASNYDPWPLVIVEAAAAGLPILCTESCGSSVELVRPHFNGLTVATANVDALAHAMTFFHDHPAILPDFGRRSREFAAAYAAEIWADRWIEAAQP